MRSPKWWTPPWTVGSPDDPDTGWDLGDSSESDGGQDPWPAPMGADLTGDDEVLAPLAAQFEQVRSRDRVRDLAEVFTHQREVDAILDLVADAFNALDVKFLEPACGSGNFLVEILRRKLNLVAKADCPTQEHYEHRLLRAIASIYGVDISAENIAEARSRMAHVLLDHYHADAGIIAPSHGFHHATLVILDANIVQGDTLNEADRIQLCDWQPRPGGAFQPSWSYALLPPTNLFAHEFRSETAPSVHYSKITTDREVPHQTDKLKKAKK